MTTFRIALANLPFPDSPADSVARVEAAIAEAGERGAGLVCFPEAFVPGYRLVGRQVPPPDADFLEGAWSRVASAAARASVAVVLGTERLVAGGLRLSALVVDRDGTVLGWQDKVQLDPSEDDLYAPGTERQVFQVGPLTFGVVICHEGWRYPETVRFAARRGAHVVFHPHVHVPEPGGCRPTAFGDPANTFHEKAALCRAAENTCFFATVNCASAGSGTTSAVVRPDGTLLCWQPYGEPGLLVAELDLREATGLLARRWREPAQRAAPAGDGQAESKTGVTVFVLRGETLSWVGVTTDLGKRLAGLQGGPYVPHALRGKGPLTLALTVETFPGMERGREAQSYLEALSDERLLRLVQGEPSETAALRDSFSDLTLRLRGEAELRELELATRVDPPALSGVRRTRKREPQREDLSTSSADAALVDPDEVLPNLRQRLKARDWTILQRRVISSETLQQIGDDLVVSRERIRQLEVKVRRRVSSYLRKRLGGVWPELSEIYKAAHKEWGFLTWEGLLEETERLWGRALSTAAREDFRLLFHFVAGPSGVESQVVEGQLVYCNRVKHLGKRLRDFLAGTEDPAPAPEPLGSLRVRELERLRHSRAASAPVDAEPPSLIGQLVRHERYGAGRVEDHYVGKYRSSRPQVMVRFGGESCLRVIDVEALAFDRAGGSS